MSLFPLPGYTSLGIKFPTILISENLGNLIGAGTALEDIVNEHKKKETTDRSKILWFIYFEYFLICMHFLRNASSSHFRNA